MNKCWTMVLRSFCILPFYYIICWNPDPLARFELRDGRGCMSITVLTIKHNACHLVDRRQYMFIKINTTHPDIYKYKYNALHSWGSCELSRKCNGTFCLACQSSLNQLDRMPWFQMFAFETCFWKLWNSRLRSFYFICLISINFNYWFLLPND